MKLIAVSLAFFISLPAAQAQLKAAPVCPPLVVDVLEGHVSHKIDCSSTSGEVQKQFPCFTEVVEETNGTTCGAVLYKDKDIYFYTERDYIEIREKFKGTLEPALMGVNRNLLFKLLGNPKMKDAGWEAYQTKYGTLILYFNGDNKINKIQITNKSTETIKLCE
ncbi:MAG: hypothetical protein V4685_05635 [Bacteroidota bacterium]